MARKKILQNEAGAPLYTVSEVCKRTGVTPRTLYHYDDIGLLVAERSGEQVANNQKLYTDDDLEKLGRISILKELGFKLEEIKSLYDGDEAALEMSLELKMERLKRDQTRMRYLILFSRYVTFTGSDLIEGLLLGPSEIQDISEFCRESETFTRSVSAVTGADDVHMKTLEDALCELTPLMDEFSSAGADATFAAFEHVAYGMHSWWTKNICPWDEAGFFGWYAQFEELSFIAAKVEELGGVGYAGFLEMALFFVWLKHVISRIEDVTVELDIAGNGSRAAVLLAGIATVICQEGGIRDIPSEDDLIELFEEDPDESDFSEEDPVDGVCHGEHDAEDMFPVQDFEAKPHGEPDKLEDPCSDAARENLREDDYFERASRCVATTLVVLMTLHRVLNDNSFMAFFDSAHDIALDAEFMDSVFAALAIRAGASDGLLIAVENE